MVPGILVGSGRYLCGAFTFPSVQSGESPGNMWLLQFLVAVGLCFLALLWLQLCFDDLCLDQGVRLL